MAPLVVVAADGAGRALCDRLRDPNCDLWAETLLAAHLTVRA
jgi:hypothetical protein